MQDDNRNKAPAGEPQETVSNDGESRRSRIAGRLRDSFGTARDGLAGTVDTVTGTAFREQFEDFTDAVTTTVVGVHQDQAEIRERLTLLEQRSEPTAIPMAYAELKNLAASYPAQPRESLPVLAGEFRVRYERQILELAAIASDVGVDGIVNLGLEPGSNPQLLEAFQLQFPNQSLDSLKGASQEQLQGWTNGVKGKYSELLVAEKLNSGESIGDIRLLPGEFAKIAESPAQAGWDIAIVNETGETVEEVQLKATDSFRYIKEAFEKYPDIRIIAPQELEAEAILRKDLLTAGISNEDLEEAVDEQIGELNEDLITDILDQSAEFAFDTLPVVSAVLIGVSEGRQILMGRSTVEESLHRGTARIGRSAVYSAIGAGLAASGVGLISIPTVTALKVAEGRVRHRMAMEQHLEEMTREILRETEGPHRTTHIQDSSQTT